MSNLIAKEYLGFEQIKRINDVGNEFWYARELAPVLEYSKWENFSKVLDRAMLACKNSGFTITDQFVKYNKLIEMPSKPRKNRGDFGFPDIRKTKEIVDYKLTRYACYLIVQNGDPRKDIIATGQTYFAIQTRRQEVADYFNQLDEDNKRLVIRGDIKQWNQMLTEVAHNAGSHHRRRVRLLSKFRIHGAIWWRNSTRHSPSERFVAQAEDFRLYEQSRINRQSIQNIARRRKNQNGTNTGS